MPLLGDPGSGDILIGESTVESNGRLSTRLDRGGLMQPGPTKPLAPAANSHNPAAPPTHAWA